MKNITFINAGAGSGKTFRLTEELYNAIDSNKCEGHQVLLTTFTTDAAKDIKVKAREKLLEKGKLSEANDLQNAFIGTVHAVAVLMIKKFWHYIGFPKDIKVIDDDDVNFYFNQAIAEIPNSEQLSKLNKLNYKLDLYGKKYYEQNRWKEDLLKIISLTRTNKINDFNASKEESLEKAKTILNTDYNTINEDLIKEVIPEIIKIGQELPDQRPFGGTKKSISKLSSVDVDNIKFSELLSIKSISDSLIKYKKATKEINQVSQNLERIPRSKNLLEDIKSYNSLLFELAELSLESYKTYKQQNGLLDYSDMEEGFLNLLDIEYVKEEIENTIKLVMVDEFQDSSPIQLAIFIKLSNIVKRSIWVGDPKQSIFAFRGTDPKLIEAITTEFRKENNVTLSTDNLEYSWRSRPEIISLVNEIFADVLKDHINTDEIRLNPVRTNNGFNVPALNHYNFISSNSNADNYYKSIAESVYHLSKNDWVVSDKQKSIFDINPSKEKVEVRKLNPGDIAILCKTNAGVLQVAEELKQLGLKVNAESYGLENTAEFKLIIALLKLIESNHNSLAIAELKVLTQDNYSSSKLIDDRLELLNTDGIDSEKQKELISEWGKENPIIGQIIKTSKELKKLPVPQVIERLINQFNLYTIVSKWSDSSKRINNLQKITSYAHKYDDRCISMGIASSNSGFINYLNSLENISQSLSKGSDSVNIKTYHKSKGLEWPCVILADYQKDVKYSFIAWEVFGVRIQNKTDINLDKILDDRTISLLPWPFGSTQSKVSDDFQNHINTTYFHDDAIARTENETKRVMYVGMTRARDYLISTGMSKQKDYKWIDLVNKHDNWSFANSINCDNEFVDIYDRNVNIHLHHLNTEEESWSVEPPENVDLPRYFKSKTVPSDIINETYFVSPSKVVDGKTCKVSLYMDIQNRIPTGKTLEDKESILGDCLHDIFYLMLNNPENGDINTLVSNVIKNYNLEVSLKSEDVVKSFNVFYEYISSEFKPQKIFTELALETEIDNRCYKGEIDLLLETDEGYIIIDYKSFLGDFKRVLDASTSNYAGKHFAQLNTYAKMIENVTGKTVNRKFIYYSVLGKLVELI